MGVIYRGIQEPLGREVAVKVMTESLARDRTFVDRFIREAQIASRLNHPQIVHIYDQGQLDGYLYIAMEMVPGNTLAQLLVTRGRFPISEVVHLARQICDVLAYAHAEGVIHRDIKPSNLILDRHGKIKITDFGLAKAVALPSFTATGELLGSPDYLSPEQFRGQPADERTDIYAVGLVLFELATGQRPYSADDPASLMYKVLHEPVPSPRHLRPEVPGVLERAILRSLAKAPSDRHPSATALLADLQAVDRIEAPPLPVPAERTGQPQDLVRILWQTSMVVVPLGFIYSAELFGVASPAARPWLNLILALSFTAASGLTLGVGPGALTGSLLALGQLWLPHPFSRGPLGLALTTAFNLALLTINGAIAGWAGLRPRRAALSLVVMGASFYASALLSALIAAATLSAFRDRSVALPEGLSLRAMGPGAMLLLLLGYAVVGSLAIVYFRILPLISGPSDDGSP